MTLRYFDAGVDFRCRCGRADCPAPVGPHRLLGLYLDRFREMFGLPLLVTSGNRCAEHHAAIYRKLGRPAPESEHVWPEGCLGVDVVPVGLTSGLPSRTRFQLREAARHAGLARFGHYEQHVHVGVGDIVAAAVFPPNVEWLG